MNRTEVNSSNIRSIGYDEVTKILEVEFRDKAVYQYAEVPPVVFLEMSRATSLGKFFFNNIRDNYECKRI